MQQVIDFSKDFTQQIYNLQMVSGVHTNPMDQFKIR